MIRFADLPPELCLLMEGPPPHEDFESDGCTCVFDVLIAEDCRPACFFHDAHYALGGTEADRRAADFRFYRNLRHLDVGKLVATARFLGVRACGWLFFRYTDGGPKHPWKSLRRLLRGNVCT